MAFKSTQNEIITYQHTNYHLPWTALITWYTCSKQAWTKILQDFMLYTHDDTIMKTSDTILRKIYLSLYLKGLCVRGSWRLNRTATYWPPPSSSGHSSVSFILQGCSTGGLGGPALCWVWFSLQHHFSNSDPQTPWISCTLSYIIVQHPLNLFP